MKYDIDMELDVRVFASGDESGERYQIESISVSGIDITRKFDNLTFFEDDGLEEHIRDVFKKWSES